MKVRIPFNRKLFSFMTSGTGAKFCIENTPENINDIKVYDFVGRSVCMSEQECMILMVRYEHIYDGEGVVKIEEDAIVVGINDGLIKSSKLDMHNARIFVEANIGALLSINVPLYIESRKIFVMKELVNNGVVIMSSNNDSNITFTSFDKIDNDLECENCEYIRAEVMDDYEYAKAITGLVVFYGMDISKMDNKVLSTNEYIYTSLTSGHLLINCRDGNIYLINQEYGLFEGV